MVVLLVAALYCIENRLLLILHVLIVLLSDSVLCYLRILTDNVGVSTLLICVYLPLNDGSSGSHNDFLIVLSELQCRGFY